MSKGTYSLVCERCFGHRSHTSVVRCRVASRGDGNVNQSQFDERQSDVPLVCVVFERTPRQTKFSFRVEIQTWDESWAGVALVSSILGEVSKKHEHIGAEQLAEHFGSELLDLDCIQQAEAVPEPILEILE